MSDILEFPKIGKFHPNRIGNRDKEEAIEAIETLSDEDLIFKVTFECPSCGHTTHHLFPPNKWVISYCEQCNYNEGTLIDDEGVIYEWVEDE